MKYAVQARSWHTACHVLLVYQKRKQAQDLVDFIDYSNDDIEYSSLPHEPLDVVEIDYRRPPTTYRGENLTILNPDRVPDIYEG